MDVAKRIKEIRAKKGLKQADVAEKLNMEPSNYSRLEKRGNDLSVNQIIDVANALGVSPFEVLFPLERKAFVRATDELPKLREQNAYLLDAHKKIEAFMTLIMEIGKGFEGFGITKELFQKQLDPEGKLEQWAREKVNDYKEETET